MTDQPAPPSAPRRPVPWWAVGLGAVAVLAIALGIWAFSGGEDGTAAPGASSTTTTGGAPASTATTGAATTSSTTTTSPPAGSPAAIAGLIATLTDDGILFTWGDVDGESAYTYTFTTPAGPVSGSLPAGATSWATPAGCGTAASFDLQAVDAGGAVVAFGSSSVETSACPPEARGPDDVHFVGHTADGLSTVAWAHGVGQMQYRVHWEWRNPSAGTSGFDDEVIQGNRDSYDLTVPCDAVFTVLVTGLAPDGTHLGSAGGGEWAAPECAADPFFVDGTAETSDPGDDTPARSWANCPSGSQALGGGFGSSEAVGAPERGWITANAPPSPTQWVASVQAPGSRSVSVASHVLCMEGIHVTMTNESIEVSEAGAGTVRVSCPAGTTRTAGGWHADAGLNVLASIPTDDGWSVLAFDELGVGGPKSLRASVLCIHGEGFSTEIVQRTVSVADGSVDFVPAPSCPAGSFRVGGGSSSLDIVYEASGFLEGIWGVWARNPDLGDAGPASTVAVFGVCLAPAP
ncbi:MAG: hypothetical protein KQH83_00085 [Actinobacteria bacterium]|nr:hypothetical protein [Actinomycetota bacterium]